MATQVRKLPTAFASDRSTSKRKRQSAQTHLRWIRNLPCLATGSYARVEAAHVRYSDPLHGKAETGMARKSDDKWVVPLCAEAHREAKSAQHNSNERQWWEDRGIDPLQVAKELWAASGDTDAGLKIIEGARS